MRCPNCTSDLTFGVYVTEKNFEPSLECQVCDFAAPKSNIEEAFAALNLATLCLLDQKLLSGSRNVRKRALSKVAALLKPLVMFERRFEKGEEGER